MLLTVLDHPSKCIGDLVVHRLICGTCLIHFNLADKLQACEVTNILDNVAAMQMADKVITV